VNAETVLKVRELMHANWWITMGEVPDEVGVLCGSLKAVLTDEVWLTRLLCECQLKMKGSAGGQLQVSGKSVEGISKVVNR